MFYRANENTLLGYSDTKNPLFNDWKETNIITTKELSKDLNKVIVVDGVLLLNPDYEKEQLTTAKETKLQEALEKAYEYENKIGFITFEGRPVDNPEEPQPLSIELFNQSKFFQLVIGFSQGLLTDDFVYSTKEDVNVFINAQEAQSIYSAITAALSKLWTADYPVYKYLIDAAKIIEEIEALAIDYDNVPIIETEEEIEGELEE